MLDDPQTIDMVIYPHSDSLLLVINDFFSWPEADADDRLSQFHAKLERYAEYVASRRFSEDHPLVHRSNVFISVLTVSPPSQRMLRIAKVATPGRPSYELRVLFGSGGDQAGLSSSKKP
jgi:hypothetical protein